ncbi:MAG: sodium/proline symporter PutP [Shewanella sp.]|nr:sodium/proline symporter PutP [Shewanella sp.]MCF1437542.1 sodium/proline symporter PutP [Shewanella sp.]MCF1456586.1 sodium/proline symporter PutP [Shewanella sp.]
MTVELPILLTFAGYLILMLAIGFWAYKATDSVDDYILGDRKMGPAVTALSVGASDMSGWLLLGLPGAVYMHGLSEIWTGVGLLIGALLNWLFVARRLRVFTEMADNALTLPEFFEHRLDDQNGLLKLVSATTILLFFTFYSASGMVSGAILFEKVFGMDYVTALIIGSAIIVSYTFIGGFFAVCWTDFFQGILMLLALIIVPVTIFSEPQTLSAKDSITPQMLELWPDSMTMLGVVSLMAWGLGYFGQPHILSRFMAIESDAAIPISRNIAMGWTLMALIAALAVGFAGYLYFYETPLTNAETVFIHLVQVAFNPWVAGLLIAAIMSAIMSTIDSQLLVCSSVITEDFYRRWIRPGAGNSELLWVGRLGVLGIAIIAGVLALDPQSSVLELVSYAWAGFGAAFGPVVLLSLFWRGYSRNGAIATMLVGATTVVVWKQLNGGIFDLYEIVPGFVLATVVGWGVSRISQPNAKVQAGFDRFHARISQQIGQ